jgi:hypothetical protein
LGGAFHLSAHSFKEICIMADITDELASKCGISPDMARKGLGTLLAACKHALPAETFAQVEGAIPGADRMMADAYAEGEHSGGVLGAIKNLAGRLFGGGGEGPAALAAHFGQLGFSPDQVSRFVPQVVEFLRGKLPPEVMDRITALLPQEAAAH